MSNDVGIDRLKPKYGKRLMVAEDFAYWEVLYEDGTVLSEAAGGVYQGIDRTRLRSFRIIHMGTIVFEMFPTNGKTGHNLIYRRRTIVGSGEDAGRDVVYIVGMGPDGPFFVLDLSREEYHEDPEIIWSLRPMPGETDDIFPVPA